MANKVNSKKGSNEHSNELDWRCPSHASLYLLETEAEVALMSFTCSALLEFGRLPCHLQILSSHQMILQEHTPLDWQNGNWSKEVQWCHECDFKIRPVTQFVFFFIFTEFSNDMTPYPNPYFPVYCNTAYSCCCQKPILKDCSWLNQVKYCLPNLALGVVFFWQMH